MRLAIIATALSISLFSASAHAQSVTYVPGPNGPSVLSFDRSITDQDIKNLVSDDNFCNKLRFDAGIPRASVVARYTMQTCMNARLAANSHKPIPKWRESASQAAHLCASNTQSRPAYGPSTYRTYAAMTNFADCFAIELSNKD